MLDAAGRSVEVEALRRCVRDLVALSTLPAIWSSARGEQITTDVVEAVPRTLRAELVCAHAWLGSRRVVAGWRQGRALSPQEVERILPALRPPPGHAGVEGWSAPDPLDGPPLRVAVAPMGHPGDAGELLAASASPDFPDENERLLLSVAANQAAVALQRRHAEDALQRSQRELADFFENASVPLHLVGGDGIILRVNQAELDMLGYAREEYVGRHIAEFHVDQDVIADILQRLISGETIVERDARLRCRDGSIKQVIIDSSGSWEDGRFLNTRCFTRDVTDRRRSEETASFLAAASASLATLSEPEDTLARLAALAVPGFADWCWVDVATAGGTLRQAALVHADPELRAAAERLAQRFPPRVDDTRGPGEVLRTNRVEWHAHLDDTYLRERTRDGEHLALLGALGWRSLLSVPVGPRGEPRAVLSFATGASGRTLRDEDRRVAEDLAARAGVAMDNAALLAALREADRRKDEFLAILAHELRNPLAPVRNAVEILRAKGPPVPELEWARSVIVRQVQQMGRLVDDLLDVSRISSGKIELRRERVALASVIGAALEASRPTTEKWGHRLTVALPAEPLFVDGDVVRLGQVLLNLLDNANKYTERGGQVSVVLERDGDTAVIRVRDSGIGIPADKLAEVFEMFTQVDRSLERAQGGLGIGLTLVDRLVRLHGGSVEAQSDGPGKGSEFVVRLPLASASAAPGPERDVEEEPPAYSCRVVVVDDNRDAADSLAMLLEMEGHEVAVAYDGLAAVAVTERFAPDVVLLDLGLPKLNGYDTARRLREGNGAGTPLLVALTGWGQEEDRSRARQAGFDHHLTKPVDFVALRHLLASAAGLRRPPEDRRAATGETSRLD